VDFGLSNFLLAINLLTFARNTATIDRLGCRMSNTTIIPQLATLDGPVFTSSTLCRENFLCLRHEALHGRIKCLTITGLRPDESTRGMGRSSASPRGFESGDSNMSKLTIVFAIMQLTGSCVCSRLVMPIPLAVIQYFFEAGKCSLECLNNASNALAYLSLDSCFCRNSRSAWQQHVKD
jgi:hypothetical protein